MKKFAYPLIIVALLASCSKETVDNSMYAKIRKAVSKEYKEQVLYYTSGYTATDECYAEISYYDDAGAKQTVATTNYTYAYSFSYLENRAYASYKEESSPDDYVEICDVEFVDNFYNGNCNESYFGGSVKKAYKTIADSNYQWNFKWGSGDFAYLSQTGAVPATISRQVGKLIEITEGEIEEGSFVGVLSEPIVYTSGSVVYTLSDYSFVFQGFRLTRLNRASSIKTYSPDTGLITGEVESESTTEIEYL